MKKKLAIFLTTALVAASLTACGNKTDTENGADTQVETQEDAAQDDAAQDSADSTDAADTQDTLLLETVAPATLKVEEYVTLCDYKSLTVQVEPATVEESEVDSYIESALATATDAAAGITNRAVEEGDTVNIDYEGKLDGVAFEGGTAKGGTLTLGSGQFIDGFESGLLEKKVKPGQTVDLNLTFPDPYQNNPDLAGKEVVFTVTVNFITAKLADFNDAMAKVLDPECATVEEYREKARKALMERAELQRQEKIVEAAMQALTDNSTYSEKEIPEGVGNIWYNQNIQMMAWYASMYGMDVSAFLTPDTKAQLAVESADMAKRFVAVQAVANAEGIKITDEDIIKIISEMGYGSLSDLEAAGADIEIERFWLLYDKIGEVLSENVTVEDLVTEN